MAIEFTIQVANSNSIEPNCLVVNTVDSAGNETLGSLLHSRKNTYVIKDGQKIVLTEDRTPIEKELNKEGNTSSSAHKAHWDVEHPRDHKVKERTKTYEVRTQPTTTTVTRPTQTTTTKVVR